MLSVVIGTFNQERSLVPTLSSLVEGAAAGAVREVIVADGGSTDATSAVADVAGCEFFVETGPLSQRLRLAGGRARAPWLMFVRPGVVLSHGWVDECARFQERAEMQNAMSERTAVFRRSLDSGGDRTVFAQAMTLLHAAVGGKPHPDQPLIVAKQFYDRLGGHSDGRDPERDLISRIPRRQITLLRSEAFRVGSN
jgi:glycosyltransferase involved in cell wall biosynthesis